MMVWTTPMTAVANSVFTAAQYNIHVRDNFLETMPAKATEAGFIFTRNAEHEIVARFPRDNQNSSVVTISGTDWNTTAGPSVTAETGERAIIFLRADATPRTASNTYGGIAYEISGATTVAPVLTIFFDGTTVDNQNTRAGATLFTGLTPGSNTFNMAYQTSASDQEYDFDDRMIGVIPL